MIDIEKLKKNAYDYLASVTDEELLRDLRECGLHLESEQSCFFNKAISMKLDSQEVFLHEPKEIYSTQHFYDEVDENVLPSLLDISVKITDNNSYQYAFSNREEVSVLGTVVQGENRVIEFAEKKLSTENHVTLGYHPAAA